MRYSLVTGPAIGKIRVGGKEIVVKNEEEIESSVDVYIHVKGYSLARVTHLDVEYGNFWKFIRSDFMKIVGIREGILIIPRDKRIYCKVFFNHANEILKLNEETWAYVGVKEEGFFIGFKKEIIEKLEKVAREIEAELFE